MSFNMGKIHWIIDIISLQFVTPNRRAIEKPKKVLTLDLCHLLILFFLKESTKDDVISLSIAQN